MYQWGTFKYKYYQYIFWLLSGFSLESIENDMAIPFGLRISLQLQPLLVISHFIVVAGEGSRRSFSLLGSFGS